jgi:hypothetical protein
MGFRFRGAGSSANSAPKTTVKFQKAAPPQPTKPIVQVPSWVTNWWNQQQAKPQQPAQIGNITAPPPQGPTAAQDYINPARGYQGQAWNPGPLGPMPKPPSTLPPFFQNRDPNLNAQSALTSTVPGTYASGYAAMGQQAQEQARRDRANAAYAARYTAMANAYKQKQAWQDFHWGKQPPEKKLTWPGVIAPPVYGPPSSGIPQPPSTGGGGYDYGGGGGGGGGGYPPVIGTPDLPSWYLNMLVWDY